ncbi:hypothetical protein PAPYR_2766 [Paratrimastix pyriformis]|uniref:Uncharacterized protein n=1 Tax=Paratrimastix pyriformis TaxID=342808 RepID=A0ABQ8UVY3_9EUKA|nr:hypothetical protein PAPYR_2766 [Paratrimastix pyriformis]
MIPDSTPDHFRTLTRRAGTGRICETTEPPDFSSQGRRHLDGAPLPQDLTTRRLKKTVCPLFTDSDPPLDLERRHLPPPPVEKVVPPAQKKHFEDSKELFSSEIDIARSLGRRVQVPGRYGGEESGNEAGLEDTMGRHGRVSDPRAGIGGSAPGDKPYLMPEYSGRYYQAEGFLPSRVAHFEKTVRIKPLERKIAEALKEATAKSLANPRLTIEEKRQAAALREDMDAVRAEGID